MHFLNLKVAFFCRFAILLCTRNIGKRGILCYFKVTRLPTMLQS